MGLYGICSVAAACCVVAVALYSREEAPPSDRQVALVTSSDAPSLTPRATATPTPALAPIAAPVSVQNKAGDSSPMWQPILDAAASLFAAASASATSTAEPAPAVAATPDAAPPQVALATVPPNASADAPTPPAPTAEPTPSVKTPAAADPAPSATAAEADVAEAPSSAPPIWAVERKPTHKVAKATPAIRRDEAAAANVLAMRNDGYAALQDRRYRDALALLQQATTMGDPYAPLYIGQIFEKGIGVPRDVGQASYWYGIAINRGNGAALAAFNRLRVNPY